MGRFLKLILDSDYKILWGMKFCQKSILKVQDLLKKSVGLNFGDSMVLFLSDYQSANFYPSKLFSSTSRCIDVII